MTLIPTPYEDLLAEIYMAGSPKEDRTGTGTLSRFGCQIRYDLADGFPLLTTKKVHFKSVAHELLWFLSGSTSVKPLQKAGVTIWDEWADEDGELGRAYGSQWRTWTNGDPGNDSPIDQISNAMRMLQVNPDSRRNLITAWNPAEVDDVGLPPCHVMFQLYAISNRLSLQVYQRSADMFLGVPFNIASYALLTHMFAAQAGMEVGDLIWVGGDCHIYSNHMSQVWEQLERKPRPYPTLVLNPDVKSIFDYTFEDIIVHDYDPHPAIKAPVAV